MTSFKKNWKKQDEFLEYLGEYVTICLKDCITIVDDGEGNKAKMGLVEGYVVDVSPTHIRIGETPEKDGYTHSVDFDVVGIIMSSDENIMGNLMANTPNEDEEMH